MKIITRAGWGARKPKSTPVHVAPTRREYFIVHHSGAPATQSARAIQDWCMDGRGFSDVDYNWLIGQDGTIYEGRGWDIVGAHTVGYNTVGVGVCVIGDNEISDAAKTAVLQLYRAYTQRCGRPLAVRGHRQLATTGTTCPGDRIFAWVRAGMPAPAPEEDIMATLDDDDIDKIAIRCAEKVWGYSHGTASTEKRWPGAGKKSAISFLELAAMGATDAAKGVSGLLPKDGPA